MTKCSTCNKVLEQVNTYKCRICDLNYCEDCSLEHFGLYKNGVGEVKYKNIFKTMLWLLRKRIIGR